MDLAEKLINNLKNYTGNQATDKEIIRWVETASQEIKKKNNGPHILQSGNSLIIVSCVGGVCEVLVCDIVKHSAVSL